MFDFDTDHYHMIVSNAGLGDIIRGYLDLLHRWRRIARPVKIYTSMPHKIDLVRNIMDLFVEQPDVEFVSFDKHSIPDAMYQRLVKRKVSFSETHVLATTKHQTVDYRPIVTKQRWTPGNHVAVYHTNFKVDYGVNTTVKNLARFQWEALEIKTLNTNNKLLGLPLTFKQSVDILLNCRYAVGIEGGWTHVAQLYNIPYYVICNEPNPQKRIQPRIHHSLCYRYFENIHFVNFQEGLELIN